MLTTSQIVINISCKDRPGLLHLITNTLYKSKLNIISLQEHVEREAPFFFSRVQCEFLDQAPISQQIQEKLKSEFYRELPEQALVSIKTLNKKKIIIMVSKEYHCLSEIILRCKYDTLPAEILAVIGNHDNTLKALCEFAQIPFYFIPSPKELPRDTHEQQILDILNLYKQIDYIILARYMRILDKNFIAPYKNKIINIHHSFLPAFVGSNPYKQAFQRGVKLIGATAHFVTEQLDEGPIISQQVLPITHSSTVKELQTIGRNIEKITLANAIEQVFNDRVFVYGNKTIIL